MFGNVPLPPAGCVAAAVMDVGVVVGCCGGGAARATVATVATTIIINVPQPTALLIARQATFATTFMFAMQVILPRVRTAARRACHVRSLA
jgi:hypothetical protein